MTIVEFLRARLDEDEAVAQAAIADDCGQDEGFAGAEWLDSGYPGWKPPIFGKAAAELIRTFAVPARVLREVEAKRKLIKSPIASMEDDYAPWNERNLEIMAEPYADHPDYDTAWTVELDN